MTPMLRFSIRNMLLAFVGLAIVFSFAAALQRAGEREVEGRCQSNMHLVNLAILGYQNGHSNFPPGTWPNAELAHDERISWCAVVVPCLDDALPGSGLDLNRAWNDAGGNDAVANDRIRVWACPGSAGVGAGLPLPTSYIGIAGLGVNAPLLPKSDRRAGVFGYDRKTTMADIKDGVANTMLIAETASVSGSWMQGGPATVRGLDPANKPYIGPGRQFGGLHRGSMCVAMADGAVRIGNDSISPNVFEALSTMAGGESLPSSW
jgi:Protein of unknown function (DUF1559)